MKCTFCGAEIQDGMAFCPACGAKVELQQETPTPVVENVAQPITETNEVMPQTVAQEVNVQSSTPVQSVPETTVPPVQTAPMQTVKPAQTTPQENVPVQTTVPVKEDKPKKKKKWVVGIIITLLVMGLGFILLIVLIIVIISSIGKSNRTISMEDDIVTYDVVGCDGYGRIDCNVNYDIVNDIERMEKMFPREDDIHMAQAKLLDALSTVKIEVEENGSFSSKDKAKVVVTYNEELFKEEKLNVKNDEFTINVGELPEGTVIDIFEGIEIEYSGFTGYGDARIVFGDVSDTVLNNVSFHLENSTNLSNGDSILVTAEYDENKLMDLYYVASESEKYYTVSGLEEIKELDPFEGLQIIYNGASPFISIEYSSALCDDLIRNFVDFTCDSTNLKNGDTFTLNAYLSDEKSKEKGFTLSELSKVYTVENQSEYLYSVQNVDLMPLLFEVQDTFDANVAAAFTTDYFFGIWSMDDYDEIDVITTAGKYLIFAKEDAVDSKGTINQFAYIYEYETSYKYREKRKEKIYAMVVVNNIKVKNNGVLTWDSEFELSASSDLAELQNKIFAKKDDYIVTDLLAEEAAAAAAGGTGGESESAEGNTDTAEE